MPASIVPLLCFSAIWIQLGRSSALLLLGPKWRRAISHRPWRSSRCQTQGLHAGGVCWLKWSPSFPPTAGGEPGGLKECWVPAGLAGPAAVLSEFVVPRGCSDDLSRTCHLKPGLINLCSLGNWGRFPKAGRSQKLFWNYFAGCVGTFPFLMGIEAFCYYIFLKERPCKFCLFLLLFSLFFFFKAFSLHWFNGYRFKCCKFDSWPLHR